jgi:hypothetical protein
MPSIRDAVNSDLSGYKPVEQLPVMAEMINNKTAANPSIRCPLPPFNIDPDTLRQFEVGNLTPQIRVIPLPQQTGGSTTISTASASSSSSGGGSSTSSLTLKSVTLISGVINVGGSQLTSVSMAKSFQLISLSSSAACNVRLYGTNAAQSFDNTRAIDAPVPAETMMNLITDIVFDTTPFVWNFQNITGTNQNTPQDTSLYITIKNINSTPLAGVTITLNYLPLES